MSYSKEKETALQAVLLASKLIVEIRNQLIKSQVAQKSDDSPVTIADFSAQAVICKNIHEAFPDDLIVGEEDSSELKKNPELLKEVTSWVKKQFPEATPEEICGWIDLGVGKGGTGRFWTLDPIDGTLGFLREGGQFAVALSLIEDGQVKLGLLGCPALDEGVIVVAEKGAGVNAYSLDLKPVEFEVKRISRLIESFEGSSDRDFHTRVMEKLGITEPPLRVDSQIKYALLVRGDGSIYLRLPKTPDAKEKIWDHSAGVLIVQEGGGTVTDKDGKALDFTVGRYLTKNSGIVATFGVNHQEVLQTIQKLS